MRYEAGRRGVEKAVSEVRLPGCIKIGHADNCHNGVTAILCPKGCMGGVDVRGGGPGTRETDLLRPEKAAESVNAIVLTGGSAYGLESACGVMKWLSERGYGFKVSGKVVPIVPAAVIFDLNEKELHYPDIALGYEACERALSEKPVFGSVGVGKGATVGKLRGMKYCCKSGIGAATEKIAGAYVTAVVAVNALGDVFDPEKGEIVAGCKNTDGSFAFAEKKLLDGEYFKFLMGNTTIGCVITNAKLNKVQTNKLASAAHNGLARTIYPVHTDYDGDTMFALSAGRMPVVNFALLQTAAVKAVERAVVNAVTSTADEVVVFDEEE